MLPIVAVRARRLYRRQQNLRLIQERARVRRQSNPFDLPDRRFIELFRFNKDLAHQLIDLLRPHIQQPILQRGINIESAVLASLRFYATGCYQRSLGQDFNFGFSQSTASKYINIVTNAIYENLDYYIKFPITLDGRLQNKADFMDRSGFPGIVGAIDGTHIAILKPSTEEHNFINRKGFHSLNVQLICDDSLKILNINANFGGASHDSFIWRNSEIQAYMRHLHNTGERTSWLIGDSGYPLQPYLMTPFNNVEPNSPEAHFNEAHIRARNVVERTIGLLKMRFRCLLRERVSRYEAAKVSKMVTVCSILHNMCVNGDVPLLGQEANEPLPPADLERIINEPGGLNLLQEGQLVRYNIVNRYFQNN